MRLKPPRSASTYPLSATLALAAILLATTYCQLPAPPAAEAGTGTVKRIDDSLAQKQTVQDLRNTGTAMMSWLTDQVSAAAAGQSSVVVNMDAVPITQYEDLRPLLVPRYIQYVPEKDGWGNPYEFYLNTDGLEEEEVMAIRSPGRDGAFEGDEYQAGGFPRTDYDRDIVWKDGFFARWPEE